MLLIGYLLTDIYVKIYFSRLIFIVITIGAIRERITFVNRVVIIDRVILVDSI